LETIMDPAWITAVGVALTALFTGVLAIKGLRDWRDEERPEIIFWETGREPDRLRLDVQVRNRSRETARLAAIAVLAPYGAVFANGQGTKVSYAESELIGPGKLVRKGLWLVFPDSWSGGEVKLELGIVPVSAAKLRHYTVHRTLALDHGAKKMPTGEHLLARVKGLPAPEHVLSPRDSVAQPHGKEPEVRSRRGRQAGQRKEPREIPEL
jgi:hypothetical protein